MSLSNLRKKRNRRNERPENPRPMKETERDKEIVKLVYAYRILSQGQLARLLNKSRSTVQQSLVRLYHHRYLERVFKPIAYMGSSPTLYILDKRGIELMQRLGIEDFTGLPDKDISNMFLEHTQAINEFRIAMAQACQRLDFKILEWKTENEIKADYDKVNIKTQRGKTQAVPVIPDSYFVIELPGERVSHFFLELDRGTMTLERFKTKIAGYVNYYKQGAYEKRFEAKGFRVLTAVDTPGEGRLNNLISQTATIPGIGRRFWFAHLSSIAPETVLTIPIWTIAGSTQPEPLFELS